MRVVIVGIGNQGKKRRYYAGTDFCCAVDIDDTTKAAYKLIEDVPLNIYDAAIVCLPDSLKYEVVHYLLENNKHVLVEKPLWVETAGQLQILKELAHEKNLVCYTGYNHRFEPHFLKMKHLLDSGKLGPIYSCRLYYGNGTARLVRGSWRDQGSGVLIDLGSHLLNAINFWFGIQPCYFQPVIMSSFENQAPDHVMLVNQNSAPQLIFEMSLFSWRNHFTCDIIGRDGSAHILSLCKWGPSEFIFRQRILPSGRPIEETNILIQEDPTWELEYHYFKELVTSGKRYSNLDVDIWIQQELSRLTKFSHVFEAPPLQYARTIEE